MAKKLSFLSAAVALLAFVIPSMASANTATCQDPNTGTYRACTNQPVTGTGENIELNTQLLGVLKCEKLNLKATITSNGELLTAKGTSEKPEVQTNCTTSEGGKIVVETVNLTNLETKGVDSGAGTVKTGTVSFVAKVKLPTGAICTFTGTNVPGKYTSTASPAKLTSTDPSTRSNITSTGGCGKAQLLGSFLLDDDESNSAGKTVLSPLIIH